MSNKTQKAADAKTVSAPKRSKNGTNLRRFLPLRSTLALKTTKAAFAWAPAIEKASKVQPKNYFAVFLIIFLFVLALFSSIGGSEKKCLNIKKATSCEVSLEVVDNESSRTLGLSGRDSLPNDKAMLFVFEQPAMYCFWMKDMKFNIDMVWLDFGKKIVKIQKDVSPNTFPRSFCPSQDALYVLEFNSGETAKFGLTTGQQLDFKL